MSCMYPKTKKCEAGRDAIHTGRKSWTVMLNCHQLGASLQHDLNRSVTLEVFVGPLRLNPMVLPFAASQPRRCRATEEASLRRKAGACLPLTPCQLEPQARTAIHPKPDA